MKSKIEFTKADESSFDGTAADRYSADEVALFSQHEAKPHVSGSCRFFTGQSVIFDVAVWDKEKETVKTVEVIGRIRCSYDFKQTADVYYFDPVDGQNVYREFDFSKLRDVNA